MSGYGTLFCPLPETPQKIHIFSMKISSTAFCARIVWRGTKVAMTGRQQCSDDVQVLVSVAEQAALSSSRRPPRRPSQSLCRLSRQIGMCALCIQKFSKMCAIGTRTLGNVRRGYRRRQRRQPNLFTILPGKPSPSTSSMELKK
jgi:hypothetical protein